MLEETITALTIPETWAAMRNAYSGTVNAFENRQITQGYAQLQSLHSCFTVLSSNYTKILGVVETERKQKSDLVNQLKSAEQNVASLTERRTAYRNGLDSLRNRLARREQKIEEQTVTIHELGEQLGNGVSKGVKQYNRANSLERELFYKDAATTADLTVKQFYKEALKRGSSYEEVEKHEMNVFSMAYEKYVVASGMDDDPMWSARRAEAMDIRFP